MGFGQSSFLPARFVSSSSSPAAAASLLAAEAEGPPMNKVETPTRRSLMSAGGLYLSDDAPVGMAVVAGEGATTVDDACPG